MLYTYALGLSRGNYFAFKFILVLRYICDLDDRKSSHGNGLNPIPVRSLKDRDRCASGRSKWKHEKYRYGFLTGYLEKSEEYS